VITEGTELMRSSVALKMARQEVRRVGKIRFPTSAAGFFQIDRIVSASCEAAGRANERVGVK
jgi:hypothetical protein